MSVLLWKIELQVVYTFHFMFIFSGKAYAVVGFSESIVPMIAGVVYAEVYYSTVDTFPGTVYLMSAAWWVLTGSIYG